MKRMACVIGMLASVTAMAADLPVRQVVLYKHGVGYFERIGPMAPGETVRLDFKASEMNDVLKSLTVTEKGGGKIAGLRYDSSEPLDQKLTEFPFRLGEKQPLSAMLDQLKGARLELRLGGEAVSGLIVGGRVVPSNEKQPEREQVTLLLDSGELRNFDLAAAATLKFTDPILQKQFKDYLAALTQARSRERRSLYIDSTESLSRQVFASYIVPMPVWKSSYRLIFAADGQPTLEGWAIVDNTTGEDWTGVQLSLVSGRPISFISRLYEPRTISRPVAELAEERAQGPVVHEGAIDSVRKEAKAVGAGMGRMAAAPPARKDEPMKGMELRPAAAPPAPEDRPEETSSIAGTAAAREVGDLFEYRIPNAVTVRKNESAMLPFLQQKTAGRKLLIYSDPSAAHPMNAAEITNAAGKTLDGGPVTVFDGGAYAGEALMETLKSGDKRLISYAVELGTRITTRLDYQSDRVREVKFRRGLLTTRSAVIETKTYTIRNIDAKAKTLIVEHSVRPQYKLINQKPAETTSTAYRFEIKLGAGATEKFAVTEERMEESAMTVANLTPDLLITYTQNKALSEAARKSLEQILEQKRRIAAVDADLRRAEAETNQLVQDQERIRRNIGSLNSVSGQQEQVQTYARQLAAQETQLATLRDRVAGLQRQRAALEADLNAMIEKMEF